MGEKHSFVNAIRVYETCCVFTVTVDNDGTGHCHHMAVINSNELAAAAEAAAEAAEGALKFITAMKTISSI